MKITKEQFKRYAMQLKNFYVSFQLDDFTSLTTEQFCERLAQYDPELANKVRAWKGAETAVHEHVEKRLG